MGVASPAAGQPATPAPLGRYFLGVGITVFVILSQYFVPQSLPPARALYDNLPGDLFVVYGIPIIAFAVLVGPAPLRNWRRDTRVAGWQGLRWFGGMNGLAIAVLLAMAVVYEVVDPSALGLLNRPNPALEQATGNPWFWVGFSFVVGAFEETIFRGYIFGYWRDRPGTWFGPAIWTSIVFAGVHLYYGTTYGPAYPLIFPSLFLTGFALAATYRFSGGNLVVPALLHGAYDATAFLTLVSTDLGVGLRYLLILAGLVVCLIYYVGAEPRAVSATPPWPASDSGAPPAGVAPVGR